MGRVYEISEEGEITVVRFTGRPTFCDVEQAICEVAEGSPSSRRMWVLGDEGIDLPGDDMQRLAGVGDRMFDQKSQVAIVATGDLAYGLSRIFSSVREQRTTMTMVFRSEEEALGWLNRKREG